MSQWRCRIDVDFITRETKVRFGPRKVCIFFSFEMLDVSLRKPIAKVLKVGFPAVRFEETSPSVTYRKLRFKNP